MLTQIRVGSLNVRGINDFYKRAALFDWIKNSGLSIIFLQETKLQPEQEYKYKREWDGDCIFNSVFGSKSGTAILLNDNRFALVKKTTSVKLAPPQHLPSTSFCFCMKRPKFGLFQVFLII